MFRLASALILAGSAALAASAPVEPERIPVDVELEQARDEAAAATAEEQRLEALASKARDEVSRLQAQQLAAAQAIAAAEARISVADGRVKIIQAALAQQRQRLAAEQAPASSLLAGLALMSRRPPILLLADSRSGEEMVKIRLLLGATMPVIQAKTAALAGKLDQGRRLELAALAARNESLKSRDELDRRREEFARLEERAIRLAESRGADALGAGDVALVRQEQFADIEQQSQSGRSAAALAAGLAELGPAPLPVVRAERNSQIDYVLPAKAAVVDGLGSVSANGVRSRGITLATRRGTPLIAPAKGTILFAGPFRDYDGVVIIDHGGGWKSVLVNAGSKLRKGQEVRLGDPLGIALGAVELQLQRGGKAVSPALIAGSSRMLSNGPKGG